MLKMPRFAHTLYNATVRNTTVLREFPKRNFFRKTISELNLFLLFQLYNNTEYRPISLHKNSAFEAYMLMRNNIFEKFGLSIFWWNVIFLIECNTRAYMSFEILAYVGLSEVAEHKCSLKIKRLDSANVIRSVTSSLKRWRYTQLHLSNDFPYFSRRILTCVERAEGNKRKSSAAEMRRFVWLGYVSHETSLCWVEYMTGGFQKNLQVWHNCGSTTYRHCGLTLRPKRCIGDIAE